MIEWVQQFVPAEGIGLVLVLFLSMMIGLEIEERREQKPSFFFGGVRTYPLIAISGFLLVIVAPGNLLPFTAGMLVLGAHLAIIYWTKVGRETMGFTTEFSAMATYILGAVVGVRLYWLAVATAVLIVLLVHTKVWLEGVARRISGPEVATFAKFLIITVVVLPLLPDHDYTRFHVNLYRTWMVVVAVSAVSYGSYLLQLRYKERGGVLLSSVLGGMYSSTATTAVLSRQAAKAPNPALYAGGILLASGMMYPRILALLFLFSRPLFHRLLAPFLLLAVAAVAGGALWIRHCLRRQDGSNQPDISDSKNPLEFSTAFFFAGIFLAVLVATRAVLLKFGSAGLFSLAVFMGAADVDPFIMGLTQTSGQGVALTMATTAILLTTASNNLAKGVYAWILGNREVGRFALAFLAGLSLLSVVLIAFV